MSELTNIEKMLYDLQKQMSDLQADNDKLMEIHDYLMTDEIVSGKTRKELLDNVVRAWLTGKLGVRASIWLAALVGAFGAALHNMGSIGEWLTSLLGGKGQ